MPFTNKYNLPESLFNALTKNRYIADTDPNKKTDYSITSLISPTQQTILKKRYPDAAIIDASELLWSVFGSIGHAFLEEHRSDSATAEFRIYVTILGKVISGQVDHYIDKLVSDYKFVKAWKVWKADKSDWEKQLNCYAWLYHYVGNDVEKLQITAFIKDWDEDEARRDKTYPQVDIQIIDLPLWDYADTEKFITERVQALIYAEPLPDELLPECTHEEMWKKADRYALIKPGAKKAYRVLDSWLEAQQFASAKPEYEVVTRYGLRRRCFKFCDVSCVCKQNERLLEIEMKQATDEEEEALIF